METSLIVFQIHESLFTSHQTLIEDIKKLSLLFQMYNDGSAISIMTNNTDLLNTEVYNLLMENNDSILIEMNTLNTFAKNRLMANFEETHPEITLRVMSSGKSSKIIKLRCKNDN